MNLEVEIFRLVEDWKIKLQDQCCQDVKCQVYFSVQDSQSIHQIFLILFLAFLGPKEDFLNCSAVGDELPFVLLVYISRCCFLVSKDLQIDLRLYSTIILTNKLYNVMFKILSHKRSFI